MLTEKKGHEKIAVIGYVIIIGFLIVAVRLWQLQIIQGGEFRQISESNRMRIIGIPAPRGIIYDRNGVPLVKNVPYFSVDVMPADFDKSRIQALSAMLGMPAGESVIKYALDPSWTKFVAVVGLCESWQY